MRFFVWQFLHRVSHDSRLRWFTDQVDGAAINVAVGNGVLQLTRSLLTSLCTLLFVLRTSHSSLCPLHLFIRASRISPNGALWPLLLRNSLHSLLWFIYSGCLGSQCSSWSTTIIFEMKMRVIIILLIITAIKQQWCLSCIRNYVTANGNNFDSCEYNQKKCQ